MNKLRGLNADLGRVQQRSALRNCAKFLESSFIGHICARSQFLDRSQRSHPFVLDVWRNERLIIAISFRIVASDFRTKRVFKKFFLCREGIYNLWSYAIKYPYCWSRKISSYSFAFVFVQANDSACAHCCSRRSAPRRPTLEASNGNVVVNRFNGSAPLLDTPSWSVLCTLR